MNLRIKILLPIYVFLSISGLLCIVQFKVDPPLLMAERFIKGAGWIEIAIIALYGSFLSYKMLDPSSSSKWRLISWGIFSIVFYSQLLLGIFVNEKFLMTGKLHLPVPAMIIAGPIYREQLSIMTLFFLSTILITGPAWCSHLCYFGAIDGFFSSRRSPKGKLPNKTRLKITMLFIIVTVSLLLLWFNVNTTISLILGIIFGTVGLFIILSFSGQKGKMIHCILYCPVGTVVNILGRINPFRIRISKTCNYCMACTSKCRYDALSLTDLKNKKPSYTCTLCGDCLTVCHTKALHYQFVKLNPLKSRILYLIITITLHATFLALAKI